MVYLILAGLVLVLILVVNLAKAEPMPLDMQEEDERLDAQEKARLVYREFEVRATQGKPLSDRLQAKVYLFPRRRQP